MTIYLESIVKKINKLFSPVFVKALTWSLLALVSCITPFEPDFKEQPDAVVVQGFISNEPGPYTIQLVRPANYSFAGYSIGIKNAVVYITDDAGNRENLLEVPESGLYKTQNLQGETGRTYQLHMEIDGKKYESKPELIRDAGEIDRVYDEPFQEIDALSNQSRLGGWNVYIDTKDPIENGNYYRWNFLHYKLVGTCGSINDRFGNPLYRVSCCGDCWDIIRCTGVNCINVANDALINGKQISRKQVGTVPVGCRDRYYLEVEQQALSRDSYVFWKTVRQLLQNTGGVFDVAPSAVPGNITCLSDPDEQVLGFFSAVGISRKAHVVDRRNSEIVNCPPDLPDVPGFPAPCTTCVQSLYRTPQKPLYWNF